ncbi:MAG: DUF512 domain-containing protein [Oscillospiraceae bacterium]|nr:DUF512 domain-containing protein [Oscillospiraceae bacterium]
MSMTKIESTDGGSPAQRAGIRVGETLTHVNGHPIVDVLDYKYYTYDPRLELTLADESGRARKVKVKKQAGQDLGLNFETYLMDKPRPCANRCLFCFVDQLPPGLRESLYFKDDDARLSFLMGNYITLTNLSARELQRIIDLRISPINISVHATNPELRAKLLGHPRGGEGLAHMRRFAEAGITMHCQIVACPGLNDGAELQRSMAELAALSPAVGSVSVVPVGLTGHRENLYPLQIYQKAQAGAVIDMVESYGAACMERHGTTLFWCSDEFYLRAARPIPADEYYEDYTQLENGVGMLRLLKTEFVAALRTLDDVSGGTPFSIACGVDAAPWMQELVDRAAETCDTKGIVYPIINHFFGESITVSGLITGQDLIAQLAGQPLGSRLLIPVNMLRHGQDVFLDDVTLAQVRDALGVPVLPVPQDGYALCCAMLEIEEPSV